MTFLDRESHKIKNPVTKKEKSVKLRDDEKEEILVKFDLDPAYGPCRGISRLQRYSRALKFGVKPAPEKLVLEILKEHEKDANFQQWYGSTLASLEYYCVAKSKVLSTIAYVHLLK